MLVLHLSVCGSSPRPSPVRAWREPALLLRPLGVSVQWPRSASHRGECGCAAWGWPEPRPCLPTAFLLVCPQATPDSQRDLGGLRAGGWWEERDCGFRATVLSPIFSGERGGAAGKGRGSQRVRSKRGSRARASKDTSKLLLLYDEDILERDPLREQKDLAFAQAYLTRVGGGCFPPGHVPLKCSCFSAGTGVEKSLVFRLHSRPACPAFALSWTCPQSCVREIGPGLPSAMACCDSFCVTPQFRKRGKVMPPSSARGLTAGSAEKPDRWCPAREQASAKRPVLRELSACARHSPLQRDHLVPLSPWAAGLLAVMVMPCLLTRH